jgi:hypothetical protein
LVVFYRLPVSCILNHMLPSSDLENRRLELQDRLDGLKTPGERNRLGQFATPTQLAVDMLAQARGLLADGEVVRFLDPAFGTGSFYSALGQTFPHTRITTVEGFEIDPHYGRPAGDLWESTPLKLSLTDFTKVCPPRLEKDKYNLLICNPPYVRHQYLEKEEKARLRAAAFEACGLRVSGLAGLYCYFLVLAHGWLASGGVAGWLVPSEFMDVNYGESLRRYLSTNVTLLRIHRFDPTDSQFADALVSSAAVWFRKELPGDDHRVLLTYGGTLRRPRQAKRLKVSDLERQSKWSRLPITGPRRKPTVTLGNWFDIKRGIATGGNRFFILDLEKLNRLALPKELVRPVLPSPKKLDVDIVPTDGDGIPLIGSRLFLLDCRLPMEAIEKKYPTLHSYLREGERMGIAERYLCRHRSPWYRQEQRPSADLLCTYMGRGGFRFIVNHSKATATNVYLLMVPKPPLDQATAEDPTLLLRIRDALAELDSDRLMRAGRVYGGGLHKLEPRELAALDVDALTREFPVGPARFIR